MNKVISLFSMSFVLAGGLVGCGVSDLTDEPGNEPNNASDPSDPADPSDTEDPE